MKCGFSQDLVDQTISFHGHWCPGLAIGIRASQWAVENLGRSSDEEIVAVVETDMCGVDAIQFLTGCTFGKGNLIYRDYGKNAFSFFRRSDGKAGRLCLKPSVMCESGKKMAALHKKMKTQGLSHEENNLLKDIRMGVAKNIMDGQLEDLFHISDPREDEPETARILSSIICDKCGEATMESRIHRQNDQNLCTPCFNSIE